MMTDSLREIMQLRKNRKESDFSRNASPSCPFLMLYTCDLAASEEGSRNFTEERLVNFFKMKFVSFSYIIPAAIHL